MAVEDVNPVAVDEHCSMVRATLDKLVAHILGWIAVEDDGIDHLENNKGPAVVSDTQGRDESIQAWAALWVDDGESWQDVAEHSVAQLVEMQSSEGWIAQQKDNCNPLYHHL